MSYKVEIEQSGRGGRVVYSEDGGSMSFDWEFAVNGVDLFVTSPEQWDAYCQGDGRAWAVGRRQEILERVAEQVRMQKASGSVVTIEDNWMHFEF